MKSKMFSFCIMLLVVIGILFISGCVQQPKQETIVQDSKQETITCNLPYIKVGTGCCLDQNNNNICDNHEISSQPKTYCGDGTCQSDESCSSCLDDCGECKASIGESCSFNSNCKSAYCVHGICRVLSTYCGDEYCDSGESCSSCSLDCGSCDVFSIGKAYAGSSDKIIEIDENSFKIIGRTEVGQTVPSIQIPIEFYDSANDVTYNFYCSGSEGYNFFAESYIDEDNPEDWINLKGGNIYFGSHFGYGSAEPFILSNKGDFGTHIAYIGKGSVRIILLLSAFPDEDLKLNCNFNVVSEEPPFRKTTTLFLHHIR